MDLPSSDIIGVVYALLPGFLAAWIFYGLTAHPKQGSFERVVQALIFTGIVQAVVLSIRWFALLLGCVMAVGSWSAEVSYIISILVAIIVGLLFALFANKDWFHGFLRDNKWLGNFTTRTSFPSEWFSAFSHDRRYVVLHLNGERRLFGWPYEWPDQPDTGHFVIVEPEWLLENNERVPVHKTERVLVPAGDIEMVEFVKFDSEVVEQPAIVEAMEKKLVEIRTKENEDVRGRE